MIIDAGELRHSVVLQQHVTKRDDLGGQSSDWEDVAKIRCRVSTGGGREFYAAQKLSAEITHAVVCRYRPFFEDVVSVAAMRLLYRDRIFNINAVVDEDELHQWITLGCTEGVNDG